MLRTNLQSRGVRSRTELYLFHHALPHAENVIDGPFSILDMTRSSGGEALLRMSPVFSRRTER